MTGFSSLLDDLDTVVEAHLCDDAVYRAPVGDRLVRVVLEHPRQADVLERASFTRARPVIRVARSAAPDLRKGHVFQVGVDLWKVAEAPGTDGDGRWWVAEVQPE